MINGSERKVYGPIQKHDSKGEYVIEDNFEISEDTMIETLNVL